jgi:RecA-family ATPase
MSSTPADVPAQCPSSVESVKPRASSKFGIWSPFIFDTTARIPPEQPIYDGLLAKGDLAIWLGREKHRKSNVLLQFAICAALGRPFLHFKFCAGKPLRVAVLDYESKSQTLKGRYDAIVAAMGLDQPAREALKANLRIVEIRKAFRQGVEFARFPVDAEKGDKNEVSPAERAWRALIQEMDADLYIIDPMRCMHAHAENDSAIEALLTRVHQFFGNSAVVISHHLRKRNRKKAEQVSLRDDMRAWADEARGSGAITAHADVIVCQERIVESGLERLEFGAYLRDGSDIEPMALRESGS